MIPNRPFVSVIVPVYNRKKLLEELLASFGELTYPRDRFEVIVVDNFSSDGTWESLQSAAENSPYTLQVFRNPSAVRSASSSRNYGIHKSVGEILAFTDSDCLVSPGWLEAGVDAFREGVGIVQGRTVPHSGDAWPILHHTAAIEAGKSFGETCNIFYSRHLVERVGGFDEHLGRVVQGHIWGEDTDLVYRIRALGATLAPACEALVIHHIIPRRFRAWITEPLRLWLYPKLVKRHPSIRQELLFGRYFFTPMSALFDVLVIGVLLGAFWHRWFFALGLPFLIYKYREGGHHLNLPLRLARVAGGSLRAFIMFCALLGGSLRYRRLIL
jgi:glycosyltransferase involved in cell wall biosynthesis